MFALQGGAAAGAAGDGQAAAAEAAGEAAGGEIQSSGRAATAAGNPPGAAALAAASTLASPTSAPLQQPPLPALYAPLAAAQLAGALSIAERSASAAAAPTFAQVRHHMRVNIAHTSALCHLCS